MEATATGIPHIAELDALIAINRSRFPGVFVISKDEVCQNKGKGHHKASPR